MIVRILNEGQWRLTDEAVRGLNSFDDAVEKAVSAADQDQLTRALHALLDRIRTTGTPVPDEELAVYYRHAAVYMSMSEHEGFCVPLVEAMAADVPILAYAAAAVPETLGGAGVQFAPKDLEQAAELAGALVFDEDFRTGVISGQRRRLQDFGDARILRDLTRVLESLS